MKKATSAITAFFLTIIMTACTVEFPKDLEIVEVIWDYLPEIDVTPEDAFEYEYDNELGGMVITDYLKASPKVRIPDVLEGEPVVEVDLYDCKKQLTEIIMPDTVIDFSFSDEIEDNLQYLNIPALYRSDWEDRYFDGSYYASLESVYISDGLERVSFDGCEKLKKVYLPDSITSIGYFNYWQDNALCNGFANCVSLESIRIPTGVAELAPGIFSGCTSLESVILNDGLTEIGNNAFESCTSLKSIKIPAGVIRLGIRAFYQCESLESVTLGDGLTEIGGAAFAYCKSLNSIMIPESVITLDNGAFAGCESLKSIKIPKGITVLADTFRDCIGLESVIIEGELTFLGRSTFWGASNVKIKYKNRTYDYSQISELCDLITSSNTSDYNTPTMQIQSSPVTTEATTASTSAVTTAATSAATTAPQEYVSPDINDFSYSDYNEGIELTGYYGNSRSVIVPQSINGKQVIRLGDSLFKNNTELTYITLPEGLKEIGELAFYCCSNLSEISIPESVETIGSFAFYASSELRSFYVPQNVREIGDFCFGWTGIENIEVSKYNKSYKSVDGVFYDVSGKLLICYPCCKPDKEFFIPEGVTVIGYYAFDRPLYLEKLEIGEDVIYISPTQILEYVREITVNAKNSFYEAYDGALFSKDFTVLYIFPPNSDYTSWTVPESVTLFEDYCFTDVKNLRRLQLLSMPDEVCHEAIVREPYDFIISFDGYEYSAEEFHSLYGSY